MHDPYRYDELSEFDEYVRQSEPGRKEKGRIWQTAIGLQAVDGLRPSEYLLRTAMEHIDGDITINEVMDRIDSYYSARPSKAGEDRDEEADKVSARITEILSEETFTFSPAEYLTIHRRLFRDIYTFAGIIRDYNISKAEWVLDGKTVYYASADTIRDALDYDFGLERRFDYKGVPETETVRHITKFISDIWQIHAFGEGNTRTTAVFAIKYLRSFGFTAENEMFASNSWYFRNALVRANYNDLRKGIHATQEYLDRFFDNLLLGGRNVLRNRDLRVNGNVSLSDGVPKTVPKGDTLNDTLNDTLKFITARPDATQEEIARGIGKSTSTVKRATVQLQRMGKLERTNGKRDGRWLIK